MVHAFSDAHRQWTTALCGGIREYYGVRLVSLAVFGSYARGDARLNSDLDLLIVLDDCRSSGRYARTQEFVQQIEMPLDALADACAQTGARTEVSPLLLTRTAAGHFNPLYLDMVTHCEIVFDREGFLAARLATVRQQMARWGSERVVTGNQWYWRITPHVRWGETIDYDQ